ncbi:MAG: Uma2 family endonuclease [Chroococcidiopsidaceae cyanobacterium CP_BM_ER_R8_30]|nr:Uma2 family endonuclease [Chroococcidiopsidaceae cyanobacterium CP_BM_ER_R8_30]
MTQLLEKTTDLRMIYHDRTWEQFKLIQKGFEGLPGVRLSYYEGMIELLMPGQDHELFGCVIRALLFNFFAQKGIFFLPSGSMTQEREGKASVQADKSFCIGSRKPIPDLSIEVIFTSGSESKLAVYQALGVLEVWFWQDGVLRLHHLRESGYERIERSELPGLEDLDIELLKRCILIAETDPGEAARVFQREILQ